MNNLNPYNFIFELPLYTKVTVTKDNEREFFSLMTLYYTIDAYNPILKQETTYKVSKNPGSSISPAQQKKLEQYTSINEFEVICVRNGYKINIFSILTIKFKEDEDYNTIIEECYLMKIGQSPSIADLHISKFKQYDKVLPKDKLKEITKSIGLAANGVGIGSFVYLRRVFEFLIEEAHGKAKIENSWNEIVYNNSRIGERIDLLKDFLPSFLIENKAIYSILSKGIHELEENECLQYFEAIKVGIELILDEKEEVYKKAKKIEDAQKRIQSINQILKS